MTINPASNFLHDEKENMYIYSSARNQYKIKGEIVLVSFAIADFNVNKVWPAIDTH